MQSRASDYGKVWHDPAREALARSEQGYSAGAPIDEDPELKRGAIVGIVLIAVAATYALGRAGLKY
jgi:hypothetical protein